MTEETGFFTVNGNTYRDTFENRQVVWEGYDYYTEVPIWQQYMNFFFDEDIKRPHRERGYYYIPRLSYEYNPDGEWI